jgi:hypothetical protein
VQVSYCNLLATASADVVVMGKSSICGFHAAFLIAGAPDYPDEGHPDESYDLA